MGSLSLPLEGIRIVAISQYGAGPYATMHLADLGAEVIKIEDPSTRGDSAREVRPYTQHSDSLFYQSFNRNKKSVTLNLRNPSARDVFHRLVKVSDVVFNNLRGDQPAKLGLNYGSLRSVNPKVVCSALSGFGTTGSKAVEPSYDYMLQAYCGLEDITGNPGTPPTRAGIPVIDLATGFAAALAVMTTINRASSLWTRLKLSGMPSAPGISIAAWRTLPRSPATRAASDENYNTRHPPHYPVGRSDESDSYSPR